MQNPVTSRYRGPKPSFQKILLPRLASPHLEFAHMAMGYGLRGRNESDSFVARVRGDASRRRRYSLCSSSRRRILLTTSCGETIRSSVVDAFAARRRSFVIQRSGSRKLICVVSPSPCRAEGAAISAPDVGSAWWDSADIRISVECGLKLDTVALRISRRGGFSDQPPDAET